MDFPDRKCTLIGLRFFPLFSADVCGTKTCDEPLRRTSAWEAPCYPEEQFPECKGQDLRTISFHRFRDLHALILVTSVVTMFT